MATNEFYTNNFRGRAGRRERAKHLVDEFKAIEDGFAALQAYNIATYLTIYTNTTSLSGEITIRPDNGYLQELTLTDNITIYMADPLNESQYRVSLLIHGGGYKVTNGWGAQTWKEYGGQNDNWWELFTADGPFASMLLDFWWDICSHTWICVASSKNINNSAGGGAAVEFFYPLLCSLWDRDMTSEWNMTRAGNGNTIDNHQQYHYLPTNGVRYHGVRWVENWCPTASDLTTLAWVPTNCTVTTDAGAGPISEDVQRLSFDVTDGKLGCFILPSFGRASTAGDPIKVALSFKGRSTTGDFTSLRVVAALCGKTDQEPPVHESKTITLGTTWQTHGAVLDIFRGGNDNKSMALDQFYPKCLLELSFMSPSGSAGEDIQITDVQIEVYRGKDEDDLVSEIQDTTIGTSINLSGTGTGSWDDGTKTLTLATVGQYVDLSGTLEAGKTYLVDARLQNGDAADIRMQNDVTVWGAGPVSDSLYVQEAPFTFQYDGGNLKFVLMEGVSAVYLVDVYEVSNNRKAYCYENPNTITVQSSGNSQNKGQGQNKNPKATFVVEADTETTAYDSGILLGTAREIQSTNLIPYEYFRTFTAWDQSGLSGVEVNDCRNPVFQSEYGIDGWPSRATLLQGASRVSDGFIQRAFTITPATDGFDIQFFIRRTLDVEGNQVYTPQYSEVVVPLSRYVDFEAELSGGTSTIESGRIRLDLQTNTFVGLPSGYNYKLGVFLWDDWLHCVIGLDNDGTHDTFTVRVYPASANDPDPSVIDVETQGWCVIDWCQFEQEGGTFGASSPMIGGLTRNTEDFTTSLPDGEIYATYQDGSFLDEPNKKVADVVGGSINWLTDDYVWRNLIYSTTALGGMSVYNMHEFGLVDNQQPPAAELTLATTTIYPIEVVEALQLDVDLQYGEMRDIITDEMDGAVAGPIGGELIQILLTGPTMESELDGAVTLGPSAELLTILIYGPTMESEMDGAVTFLDGILEEKLVTALAPDESLQLDVTLDEANCSMSDAP